MISFLIAPSSGINGLMCVIEFLLRHLISHKNEKPFLHKYVVGIYRKTEIAPFALLLYSGTFSRCLQNSVHGVSLNNAFMPKFD